MCNTRARGVELKEEIDRLIEIIRNEDLAITGKFVGWFNNYLSGQDGIREKDNISRKIENVMKVKALFATKLKEHDEKLLEQGIERGTVLMIFVPRAG